MKVCKICKKKTTDKNIERYGMCYDCYNKIEVWKLNRKRPINFSKIKTTKNEDVDEYGIYDNFERLWNGIYIVKNINRKPITFDLIKHSPDEEVGQFFEDIDIPTLKRILKKIIKIE